MLRMARSIRTSHYLHESQIQADSDYVKQIYIKNSAWHPPPAPWPIEEKITNFEKELKKKQKIVENKYKKLNTSNLTPLQTHTLRQLRDNKAITIKPTDKNLGPAVMDTSEYVNQVLTEHLLTKDYKQLTQPEATNRMDQLKDTLKKLISSHSDILSKAELTYFKRSLSNNFRLPIFYGLPKVHKTPFSLRPVVSTTNSLLAVFSIWLDYKMKELLPFIKSYIKNSIEVINDLKTLHIPENALLFSADAISMYTNIDTASGLLSMHDFLIYNQDHIPTTFPKALFLEILETVMNNNIFSFSNTFWHQLSGTAMGTPAACAYATITFGHFENTVILPRFNSNLLYYKRYIDDIFGIWLPSTNGTDETWRLFTTELNKWGRLKWKIEQPSLQTVFLDLNIQLKNQEIITSTYQKAMNLYLYIPPLSAHPPSCLKGLIAGEMRRYWLQNNLTDFKVILSKFIDRLLDRGHTIHTLKPIFIQAATALDNRLLSSTFTTKQTENTLYIHRTFHPNGIKPFEIRQLYEKILRPSLTYDRMIIATSRPKNLKDVLTRTALPSHPKIDVQETVDKLKASLNMT